MTYRMTSRVYSVLSVIGIVVLWMVAAAIAQSRLFPGPMKVLLFLSQEIQSGSLLFHLSITLLRVAAAYVIAMAIGCAIGLLMGQSPLVNRILDPWLIVLLNIPALVVMILAFIWVGLTEVAAIGAVAVNKIPNVVATLREGARALDPGLDDMARSFRMTPMATLRHVTIPQLQPYFAAASRSGLALIWKIVLVVELLGRSNGVGFQIHLHFQLFDVTAILGYTIAFVIVMLLVEILLVQPLERYSSRWRLKPA